MDEKVKYESTRHEMMIRDTLADDGDAFIGFKDWRSAEKVFGRLVREYPYDERGWWGLIRLETKDLTETSLSEEKLKDLNFYYQRVVSMAENPRPMQQRFEEYRSRLAAEAKMTRSGKRLLSDKPEDEKVSVKDELTKVKLKLKLWDMAKRGTFWILFLVGTLIGAIAVVGRVKSGALTPRFGILQGFVVLGICYLAAAVVSAIVGLIANKKMKPLKQERKFLDGRLQHLYRYEERDEEEL